MISFDLDDILNLEKYYRISLINKISGIRSGNLIGTKSKDGISNLAIFNSVTHIGANPPLLGFLSRPLTVERHTYQNIKDTGFFTINSICSDIHKRAHLTSAKYNAQQSEFSECKLTEQYLDGFEVPYVEESKIKIGLSLQEELRIQSNDTILLIGKVEKLYLAKHALGEDGNLDLELLDTIGIGGLDTYYTCKRIARYKYARVHEAVTDI